MVRRAHVVAAASVALLGLVVVPPASAGVLTDPEPTDIFLSYVVDGGQAEPGDVVTYYGSIDTEADEQGPSEPVAGAAVELWARERGREWQRVRTVTSDDGGNLQGSLRMRRTTTVQWRYAGDESYGTSRSEPHLEPVGRRVLASLSDHRLRRGEELVVTGRVRPGAEGLRIALYRGIPTRGGFLPTEPDPVRLAAGRTGSGGRYVLTVRFPHRGAKDLFVEVSRGGDYSYGQSRQPRVRVTRG